MDLLRLSFFPLFLAPLLLSECHTTPSDRPLLIAALVHVIGNVVSFVSGGQYSSFFLSVFALFHLTH